MSENLSAKQSNERTSHVFAVFRHVHGSSGYVIRSRLMGVFADADYAEEMRQVWNAQEDDFLELIEATYAAFQAGAKASRLPLGTPEEPNPAWFAAGKCAADEWVDDHVDEMTAARIRAHEPSERVIHYLDWLPLLHRGDEIPEKGGMTMLQPALPGARAIRGRQAVRRKRNRTTKQ